MPTQNRDGGANARMFKENFLAAGGLGYVCHHCSELLLSKNIQDFSPEWGGEQVGVVVSVTFSCRRHIGSCVVCAELLNRPFSKMAATDLNVLT